MKARYWHGGVPDLKPGDLLLPPSVTGTEQNLTTHAVTDAPAGHVRPDRVHLTTNRAAGKAFAAAYPDGALYVAEPLGEVEPDPDAPGEAIRCESARVVSVYDPCVRWAERGTRWLAPLMRGAS